MGYSITCFHFESSEILGLNGTVIAFILDLRFPLLNGEFIS